MKKMLDPFSGEVVEFGKAAPNVDDPMFGTDVRSVAPRTPEGPGVSHENKLLVLGTRKRSKKPPPALVSFKANKSQSPNFAKSLQGAAVKGERGTPMSSMAHNGRVGRKLRVV